MHVIRKEFGFEAAHQLHGLPEGHKCGKKHGHSYRVAIELSAESLDSFGFVTDFANLRPVGDYIRTTLDHSDLNELQADDGSGPVIPQPSSELIAQHVYKEALRLLPEEISALITAVLVSETASSSASYVPPRSTV